MNHPCQYPLQPENCPGCDEHDWLNLPIERAYGLGDGKVLVVQLTKEGVVADAYDNDKIVGTFIETADEFYDFVMEFTHSG